MKKVLFFIPTLGQGGAEKVLVNLVNNMDKSKYDVTVQVLFDGGVNTQFLNKDVKYKYVIKNMKIEIQEEKDKLELMMKQEETENSENQVLAM